MKEKQCSRCKQAKPISEFWKGTRGDGYYYYCKSCSRATNREWKAHNPEATKQHKHTYYVDHKEECNLRSNEWARNNPEARNANSKRYYYAHPDANAVCVKRWRKNNPDRTVAYKQNRRAREMNAEGTFTNEEWIALCKAHDNQCVSCGQKGKLTVDHILSLTKGGTNHIWNIQPLCGKCNSSKGTRTINFIEYQGRATTLWEYPKPQGMGKRKSELCGNERIEVGRNDQPALKEW